MAQRRALLVTPAYSLWDDWDLTQGHPAALTPTDTWSGGLGQLLDRVGKHFDGQGAILLDGSAARALRLPSEPAEVGTITAGLDEARAAGWKVTDVRNGWATATADGRPTIIISIQSLASPARCPLFNPDAVIDRPYAMSLWQELTGVAWRGTPGTAGMVLMRATAPEYPAKGGKAVGPTWKSDAGPEGAAEKPWEHSGRFRRDNPLPYAHSYDGTRMYLAAAGTCESLAPWTLRHHGKQPFNRKYAGWWKVELAPWNDDRLPDPAGPGKDRIRWVTTPTAALLSELTDQGVYGGIQVIDSWTNVGKRPLRTWAETIERTYQTAATQARMTDADGTPSSHAQDAERVRLAAKEVYRESWGLLNTATNSVHRPDWHYTILAYARATLWRKLWKVGTVEGRWPVEINVDNVWYGSDLDDPRDAMPVGLSLVNAEGIPDTLGTFKIKGTRGSK